MSTPKVTKVSQIPGGISAFRAAVADVQQITDKVRKEVEGLTGETFKEFVAVTYQTQVVNGINYYIKVQTDDKAFMLTIVVNVAPGSGDLTLLEVEIPMIPIGPGGGK